MNAYVRQMTLTVLDFRNMWQYFDVSKYPNGTTFVLNREIYSDPHGTCDSSGNIVLLAPPTQPISQITIWAWDRIDAAQVSYPAGGGPGGVTTTGRMGNKDGGSNAPPHGGVFQVSTNPVVEATGISGHIVNGMSFTFAHGGATGRMGGGDPGGGASWSFPNEILSSIHINGVSRHYASADCVVFGFKFNHTRTVSPKVRQILYATAPVMPANLLAAGHADSHARDEYWSHLASQAGV